MGEQNIGASILAKFQQISNEKELARNAADAIKPVKECTSSDIGKCSPWSLNRSKPKSIEMFAHLFLHCCIHLTIYL